MKSKYALAAVLVLLIIAFAGISTVSAAAYECYLEVYQKQNDVVVWHFDTIVAGSGFSGKDIDTATMQVKYYLYTGPNTPPDEIILTPSQIHLTTKSVDLIFKDPNVFPEDSNPTQSITRVLGTLTNGVDTFIASGPGFTYRPH